MSLLSRPREHLNLPLIAVILFAVAALAWGLALRSQLSPARKHVEAGVEFAHKGQGREAEHEWRTAASLDPEDFHAWVYLGEYYLAIHNWPAALEALHQLERLKPDSPHLQARLATASMNAGDEVAAYHYAEASLKIEPNDPDTILLFCGLLANTKENLRRLDLLRHLANLQADNLTTQLLLAATLTDKRQFDEARPLVEKILQRDPANLEASSLRGMIMLNSDSSPAGLKQAESDFLKTVSSPQYAAFAHYNLGKIYRRMGRPKDAVSHLEEAVRLLPLKREAWFELSEACAQAGQAARSDIARAFSEKLMQQETAIKELEKRCAANPDDFEAHIELTKDFLSRRDLHKADIHLEQVKRLRPNDPRVQIFIQKLAAASGAVPSSGIPESSARPPEELPAAGGR